MKRQLLKTQPLVLSAASGAGHVRAAEALVAAFGRRGHEARHIEVLKHTTPVFRKVYSDLYIELVNKRPEILGWVYDSLDRPWKYQKRRLALNLLNTGPLVRLLKQEQPPLAVCTHFLPAEILVHLRSRGLIDLPIGIVVTDIDAHALWLYRGVDWYFVACEETKVYLERLGIPAASIHVTGIPIDPVFGEQRDRIATRMSFGLDPALPTVLVSSGGFGMGLIEAFVRALDELKTPAQAIVICGRNEKLRAALEKLETKRPVKVVGFTDEMDRYMAASDILLGKAGGLTSSEALARGLAMVIVNPVPGQEERNSDHLLEEGVAIRCNNLPALSYKIDRLLGDRGRLHRMQQAAKRLGRPNAAADVVSVVLKGFR